MPTFVVSQRFPFPRVAVFDFFRRPANLVAVAPPELRLRLAEAPDALELGSRMTVKSRRYGLATEVVTEVVELLAPERIVEEQRRGPFRLWRHERVFVAIEEALTDVSEHIEYEPPGGLLGLALTARSIAADLEEAYRWREGKVLELLATPGA
jgi:ligand-binding SRPBCC domain-containing protein